MKSLKYRSILNCTIVHYYNTESLSVKTILPLIMNIIIINIFLGRVVCGTVYGDMHLKDLLESIVRIGYRIPVPDFYLVLYGLRCQKAL